MTRKTTRRLTKRGKTAKKTAKVGADVKLAPPSPRNAVRLPVGAHPGNTGGKPGRSGRPPDAFRRELESIRDEAGLTVLREILAGKLNYYLRGTCSKCGEASEGPKDVRDILRVAPSADTRLRGAEMTMRYTVGLEKVIKLEGVPGVQAAFDVIRNRIRTVLPPEEAARLLDDIQTALRSEL